MSPRSGSIEVIAGGMFSGKTEELLRRMRREQYARKKLQLFRHSIDWRHAEGHIESHSSMKLPAEFAADSKDLLSKVHANTDVVGIDEVQFYDEGIVSVVRELADKGVRVIAAGLDMDYRGEPFGPVPTLLAIAEDVTKVRAVCVLCGGAASISHRLSGEGDVVEVGASDKYEARCRACTKVSTCVLPLTKGELEGVKN